MGKVTILYWFFAAAVGAAAGCAKSSSSGGNAGAGGSGGTGASGGTGGTTDGGGTGGGAEGGPLSGGCPSGTQCSSPAGEFVCTLLNTGYPPTASSQQDCSIGQYKEYSGQGYCVQSCGPAVVETCHAGSQCTVPQGTFICTLLDSGVPPACNSTADCAYGECLPYAGEQFCMLPCKRPEVKSCPANTECSLLANNVICVNSDSGVPPTCATTADCVFGDCIQIQSQGYCVQYCDTPVYRVTGWVESYPPGGDGGTQAAPLEGVQVCVYDNAQAPCATTLADGSFVLKGLPAATFYILSMKKSGYASNLRLASAFAIQSPTLLLSDEQAKAAADAVGGAYPDSANGFISFFATTALADAALGVVDGYTATLTPQSGVGPVYVNQQGLMDKTLTQASAAGWGMYFNVAPGDSYQMQFSHSSLNCGGPVAVLVAAGYVSSNITAYCQ